MLFFILIKKISNEDVKMGDLPCYDQGIDATNLESRTFDIPNAFPLQQQWCAGCQRM